jgi:hypothetical protein
VCRSPGPAHLEETGDPTSLFARDLSRLFDGLSRNISEAIYTDPDEATVELDIAETIASMHVENRKFLHPSGIPGIVAGGAVTPTRTVSPQPKPKGDSSHFR